MINIIGAILVILVIPIALWDANNGFVVRWRRLALLAAVLAGMAFLAAPAAAHDHDHPELDAWYKSLMMPDMPNIPCCGKADAYWCDKINVKDGKTFCTITDDRPNEPLHRMPVPVGTVIEIPDHKLTWKYGNPTGHAIVFLSRQMSVYCFVQGGGV